MNIIVDNYIWFIISGAVILLTTIGYYADKTNFGKKKLGEATVGDSLSNMNNNNDEMPVIPANTPIASTLNSQIQPITDATSPINEPIPDNLSSNVLMNDNFVGTQVPGNSISNEVPLMPGETTNAGITNAPLNTNNSIQGTDDDIWKF